MSIFFFLLTYLSALLIMRALISRTSWIFLLCIFHQEPESSRPQVSIFGAGVNIGSGEAPRYNLRDSIFAAEIIASRRMLSRLDDQTTRVGVITFSDDVRVRQPLIHDLEQVRKTLDEVYHSGPYGGTNMVEGIRLGIKELLGLGTSEQRTDSIKTQLLLTDGLPSLPIGQGKRSTPEDTDLAINAARMSGRAGMTVHVFGLGSQVVEYPYAALRRGKTRRSRPNGRI
jgi:hypothetical protein